LLAWYKVTLKADGQIQIGTLLGFYASDVISLKPNVISAVYMGNGVLLVVVL
jgi:hypothetical protein